MGSVAYDLFAEKFDGLTAYRWHQAFFRGDIVLHDIQESHAPRGSFLAILLTHVLHARNSLGTWSADNDDGRYAVEPHEESLALWFLEQGCNPWPEGEPLAIWQQAVDLGWPGLMAALVSHPNAPPKAEMEGVILETAPFRSKGPAPAVLCARGQLDALKAWHALGFDVNLGVAEGNSAGALAQTPAMLKAWAQLGGAIRATDAKGRPLPRQWSFSATAKRIAMEKAWATFQDVAPPPPAQSVEQLVETLRGVGKGMAQHEFKQRRVSWDTEDASGVSLRERILREFEASPSRWEGALIHFAMEKATPLQLERALVAGLRRRGVNDASAEYPNGDQFAAAVASGRLGPVSEVLERLATTLVGVRDGEALGMVTRASASLAGQLGVPELAPLRAPIAEGLSYHKDQVRASSFWVPWFQAPGPSGVSQGWEAFASWARKNAQNDHGGQRAFWSALFQQLPLEALAEGQAFLRGAEALRRRCNTVESLREAWALDHAISWCHALVVAWPDGQPPPHHETARETAWWEEVKESLSEKGFARQQSEALDQALREDRARLLDAAWEQAAPVRRLRM